MLILTKNRFSIYKHFNVDIWGIFKSSLILRLKNFELDKLHFRKRWGWKILHISKKTDWICRFFYGKFLESVKRFRILQSMYYYRLDVEDPTSNVLYKKPLRKSTLGIKLVELFYLILSQKRIRKFVRIARKRDGLYASNYLYFLEGRIVSLIYRSNILSNIFEILRFIKSCNVLVNNKYEIFPNRYVHLFSLIHFRVIIKGCLYWILVKRLMRKAIYFNIPKYIYFSYQFLFFFIIGAPKKKDIIYPFSLDAFKMVDYNPYIK